MIAFVAWLVSALPVIGGEMTASEARHLVAGNLFSYACFDGTRGLARVHPDRSLDGSIQPKGTGPTRYGTLLPTTLRVEGERVCASLPNSIIQPCFYRTNAETFHGSVLGLSFAYCEFTRHAKPTRVVHGPHRQRLLSQTADK